MTLPSKSRPCSRCAEGAVAYPFPTRHMLPSDPLSPESLTFWIRVGTAVLCGGVIGIERQSRGKVAGVRTSILITWGRRYS